MRYAGAWRREGMLATAVTFVVPAAMAVAVAVGLLSGGLRLGAASQILTGPEVPRAASASAPTRATRSDRLPTVPAAQRPRLFGPAAVAAPAPGATARPVTTRPVGIVPTRRPSAGGAPASTAARTAPGSSPPPSSPPQRNPVRDLGRGAADAIATAPAPVGPAGHDTITSVVELVPPPPVLQHTLKKLSP